VKSEEYAMYQLPIVYSEEIIMSPINVVTQDLSLIKYENKMADYYIAKPYIVYKRQIINVPAMILMQGDFKQITTFPIMFNGIGRYLTGKELLTMRLVSKSCTNSVKRVKQKILGRFVYDILFVWHHSNYYNNYEYMNNQSNLEFSRWQEEYKRVSWQMVVCHKYANSDYMVRGDKNVRIVCELHQALECVRCNHGEWILASLDFFYGYRDFSPEVLSLLRMLFDKKLLRESDFGKIFDRRILYKRQEYILYLIYEYIKREKRGMPSNVMRVFGKYRKHMVYWHMVCQSSVMCLKSSRPPEWKDLIIKNKHAFRRDSIKLSFDDVPMTKEQNSELYCYNYEREMYHREEGLELLFFESGVRNDKLLTEDSEADLYVQNFFKRNFIRYNPSLVLRDKNEEPLMVPDEDRWNG